jgi:hypothetical protein
MVSTASDLSHLLPRALSRIPSAHEGIGSVRGAMAVTPFALPITG